MKDDSPAHRQLHLELEAQDIETYLEEYAESEVCVQPLERRHVSTGDGTCATSSGDWGKPQPSGTMLDIVHACQPTNPTLTTSHQNKPNSTNASTSPKNYPLSKSQPPRKQLNQRYTTKELQLLTALAKTKGISTNTYAKQIIIDHLKTPKKFLFEQWEELVRTITQIYEQNAKDPAAGSQAIIESNCKVAEALEKFLNESKTWRRSK